MQVCGDEAVAILLATFLREATQRVSGRRRITQVDVDRMSERAQALKEAYPALRCEMVRMLDQSIRDAQRNVSRQI